MTSLTDARGDATAFAYSPFGRVIQQTDPLGRVTSMLYDANQNLWQRTDPRGFTTTLVYDRDNRVSNRFYPHDARVSFAFDMVGNRYRMQDGTGQTSYAFDEKNRLKTVTNSFNRVVTYAYDARDRRVGMTDPDGGVFTYAYDANQRLTSLVNPQGDVTSFSYDADDRRTLKQLANGTMASYSYDAADQLLHLQNVGLGSAAAASFNYGYDRDGRVVIAQETSTRTTWTYDAASQLLTELASGSFGMTYTYDPAGKFAARGAGSRFYRGSLRVLSPGGPTSIMALPQPFAIALVSAPQVLSPSRRRHRQAARTKLDEWNFPRFRGSWPGNCL